MVSVRRLEGRRSDFPAQEWILDSGAFTEVAKNGGYRHGPEHYADQVARWSRCGELVAAVSQDYMCEPFVLAKTGMGLAEHQALTIERYDQLARLVSGTHVMPVIQGYRPHEYAAHVRAYGNRLALGAWVGVGSVCKRNANPAAIVAVLGAVLGERPDLRLHGFGIKLTALADRRVRRMLWSADSMAWSFTARKDGRGPDANRWQEAMAYVGRVEAVLATPPPEFEQLELFGSNAA